MPERPTLADDEILTVRLATEESVGDDDQDVDADDEQGDDADDADADDPDVGPNDA